MKKYNKSEIMKNAWSIYRAGNNSFSVALKLSWKRAKAVFNTDTICDLQVGDIIEMSDDITEQKAKSMCYTVESISKVLIMNRFYTVKLTSQYGNTTVYYFEPDKKVVIAIKASASSKVA